MCTQVYLDAFNEDLQYQYSKLLTAIFCIASSSVRNTTLN